jgi:hypothetical protein
MLNRKHRQETRLSHPLARVLSPLRRHRSSQPDARAPYTLVFIHIPKTAGISLREPILANNATQPSFRILHPINDFERLAHLAPEARRSLGLIEGHQYYGVHEIIEQPCVYLTMLRQPLERVLSYYSFVKEWEPHYLHKRVNEHAMTLEQCLREGLTIELDNFMVRTMTSLKNVYVPFGGVTRDMLTEAKAHLDSVSAIGLTERFDESLQRFRKIFDWPRAEPCRLNTTSARLTAASLSPEVSKLAREHNELDQELYEYATRLFETRTRSVAPN